MDRDRKERPTAAPPRVEGLHTLLLTEVADLLGCKRSEVRRRLRELAPHLEGHIRSCRGSRVVVTDTGLLALQRVRELEELCLSQEEIVERLRAELLGTAPAGSPQAEAEAGAEADPEDEGAAGGDRLWQALRTLEEEVARLGAQLRASHPTAGAEAVEGGVGVGVEVEVEGEGGGEDEYGEEEPRAAGKEKEGAPARGEEPALRPSEVAVAGPVSSLGSLGAGWGEAAARALLAGFGATGAMTLGALLGPAMGLPPMDVPGMLAGFLGRVLGPAFGSVTLGWALHFAIGLGLALGYALMAPRIPGPAVVRGALYGLLPFFMAQLIVMPMMGMGFFASQAPNPPPVVLGSLVGHVVYGAVLGALYGRPSRP